MEAYASVSGTNSNTVSYDCTYVPDEGDSDYGDSDYGDSDSDEPIITTVRIISHSI